MLYKGRVCLKTWLYCTITFLSLQAIYKYIIFEQYAYYGFNNDFDFVRCIVAWLMFMPIPFLINRFALKSGGESVSGQILCLVLMTAYLPSLVLYIYMDTPFVFYLFAYYMVFSISVEFIPCIEFVGLKIKKGHNIFLLDFIGVCLSLVIVFIWGYYAKFRLQMGFSDVYNARMEARNYSIPVILNYLRAMARGIIPLLAIYNLYLKRIKFFALYVVVQFLQFSVDGSKSVFFLMCLGIASFFIVKKYSAFILLIPKMMAFGSLVALLEKLIFETSVITNLFIRRIMFVPALLNYQFYEFISVHGVDWYRQSLSILGPSKYDTELARIIGALYYRASGTNANNGLFSDAYANLGLIGCFIMPIAITFVLKMLEGAGRRVPQEIWSVCAIHAYFSFTGSSFFTVLLTHGVLFEIIVLYLVKNSTTQNSDVYLKGKGKPI